VLLSAVVCIRNAKLIFLDGHLCTVEQATTRKIGSISDYEPPAGQAAGPRSAYQPIGAASSSSRQRQEWEETVPMSNSAPCESVH
jgi:hypothetical protein